MADCLGSLIVLTFAYGFKAIDYYVPKRPDLYADLKLLKESNEVLLSKAEQLERDVMGLRMGLR